ncbi:MAG TPA: hypothetical protein VK130_10455 [Steroidobacteraceae bacterium]|nr:hypothetical protein [Steroidobacteraceae bacterium]
MAPRSPAFLFAVLAATLGSTGLLAADDASMVRDLKATIALQGLPCDEVIDAKRNADSDYLATCKDGHHYHVFVNAQGRVMVEKQ